MEENQRILGIDPGEVNLGIALSDPTRTIASPLETIPHTSRKEDVKRILALVEIHSAGKIVIGQAINWDGSKSYQARKSARLAAALEKQTDLPVVLWNEYGSTQKARQARQKMGVSRKKRAGHLDELAAVVILQSYLDAEES